MTLSFLSVIHRTARMRSYQFFIISEAEAVGGGEKTGKSESDRKSASFAVGIA